MTFRKVKPSTPLKKEIEKPKQEDSEIELPVELLQALMGSNHGPPEDQYLDNRGIIIIDREISKQTLAQPYKKLLMYHFNDTFTEPIQLIINSPGGYCDAGWAFIDLMGFVKNKIKTVAMGEICSMATSIFIAGDERVMAPNCSTMIHQFSDSGEGNYGDLLAKTKAWDIEYDKGIEHLIKCSKYKTKKDIQKYLLKENDYWLTPQEMKKHGLCDRIFIPRARGTKK